ncbi:MAG: DUF309 domain-containing protein [Pirellulales bacterium]
MSGPHDAPLPKRLVSDASLPPYSYVTGRFPHPLRDPAGHSYGHAPATPAPLDPTRWQQARDYLWGCDLFNHGYYWEAHEVWEGLWHACGRQGFVADFLKGLIKLAAAGVKCREGRADGVRRHATRAAQLLDAATAGAGQTHFLGLDVPWLVETTRQLARQPPASKMPAAPVEIVFGFQLWPSAEAEQAAK